MKRFKQTSQFKKDLKRIQNNPKKIESLQIVLNILSKGENSRQNTNRTSSSASIQDIWNAM